MNTSRQFMVDVLKLINNSTANSLNPDEREVFFKERRRLANVLRSNLAHSREEC